MKKVKFESKWKRKNSIKRFIHKLDLWITLRLHIFSIKVNDENEWELHTPLYGKYSGVYITFKTGGLREVKSKFLKEIRLEYYKDKNLISTENLVNELLSDIIWDSHSKEDIKDIAKGIYYTGFSKLIIEELQILEKLKNKEV